MLSRTPKHASPSGKRVEDRERGWGREEKPDDLMCLGFCQTQIVSVLTEAGGWGRRGQLGEKRAAWLPPKTPLKILLSRRRTQAGVNLGGGGLMGGRSWKPIRGEMSRGPAQGVLRSWLPALHMPRGDLLPPLQAERLVDQGHPESKRLSSSSLWWTQSPGVEARAPATRARLASGLCPPVPGPLTPKPAHWIPPSVCKHLPRPPGCGGRVGCSSSHPPALCSEGRGRRFNRQGAWQVDWPGQPLVFPE